MEAAQNDVLKLLERIRARTEHLLSKQFDTYSNDRFKLLLDQTVSFETWVKTEWPLNQEECRGVAHNLSLFALREVDDYDYELGRMLSELGTLLRSL